MALYAIGDLHLCLGAPKPMDIFGGAWIGYMDKLKTGVSMIGPEDTTVLLGDLSWALDLREASADFAWINEIPNLCFEGTISISRILQERVFELQFFRIQQYLRYHYLSKDILC